MTGNDVPEGVGVVNWISKNWSLVDTLVFFSRFLGHSSMGGGEGGRALCILWDLRYTMVPATEDRSSLIFFAPAFFFFLIHSWHCF